MPTRDRSSPLKPRGFTLPPTVILLAALGVTLAIVLFGRIPVDARWAADLSNAAHGPAFALVTLILIIVLRRRAQARAGHVLSAYALAVAGALALGGAIEVLQLLTGRDASFGDLWRDVLGALAAAGFCMALDPRIRVLHRSLAARTCGFVVGIASSLLLVAPLVTTAAAYLQRSQLFPVLADFSTPFSTHFVGAYSSVIVARGALPEEMRRDDGADVGLHARVTGSGGWAVAVWEPVRDWRRYDRVCVELANPTPEKLAIRVRVRDRRSGSDRRRGVLGTIEIPPQTRGTASLRLNDPDRVHEDLPVDLADVRGLVLVRGPGSRAREFYVLRIWLE